MTHKPVFEFNLFERRRHGWAKWQLRRLDYGGYGLVRVHNLASGWTRRPKGSKYLVVRSYDGAGLPWNEIE